MLGQETARKMSQKITLILMGIGVNLVLLFRYVFVSCAYYRSNAKVGVFRSGTEQCTSEIFAECMSQKMALVKSRRLHQASKVMIISGATVEIEREREEADNFEVGIATCFPQCGVKSCEYPDRLVCPLCSKEGTFKQRGW